MIEFLRNKQLYDKSERLVVANVGTYDNSRVTAHFERLCVEFAVFLPTNLCIYIYILVYVYILEFHSS